MKRLVILGGGYGNIQVLTGLIEQSLPEDLHITVIDRNPFRSLKTEFYTIAAGTVADSDVRVDFPDDERVNYIFKEVQKIDTENEQILFEDGENAVSYDYLVIGLGCEDNYHGVPGAEEYTHSVQTFYQARAAGLAVGNLPAYGKVSIVGAGLSGIEVASEIRESRPDLTIRLLDRGDTVLKAFDSKIQDYVEAWFRKNNVDIIHNSNVEYVEKDGSVCNNGVCYLNDVTIWTAGVQPNRLVRELPFEKDGQDKIVINDFYQVPEQKNIYVLGDCAASEYSPSAQLAGLQGEQLADILLATFRGREPKKPKSLKLKGTLGSLGKSDGFGNMIAKPMTGLLPRLAKTGVLWLSKRH